jgi:hypothetical protein
VRTLLGRSVLVVVLSALAVPGLSSPPAAAAVPTPTAGQATYVPLDPVRLLDTRDGTGFVPQQQLTAGQVLDFSVRGSAGVPDTATAVILNVTATRATDSTDIRVYPTPTDGTFPTVSNLNVVRGVTAANLVTVKIGDGGRVRFRNGAGSVDLIADLSGYYADGASGASYTGTTPRRLLDTRDSSQGPAFRAGEVRRLSVRGAGSPLPPDATAVALNVTAVGPTRVTDLRVYPTRPGSGPPLVSNLNPAPGVVTAAAVIAAIGDDGTVSIRNAAGTVHVLADLAGWYTPGAGAGVFHPLAPRRLLDTRSGTPLAPGATLDLVVAGTGPAGVGGAPTPVPFPGRVVVLNVTAIASGGTDVRVYPTPTDAAVPNASNLNPSRGQTVANTVIASVGRDGAIRLRNTSGDTHLVVDLSGWYGPAGDGWDISWPQCTAAGSSSSGHPGDGAFAIIGVTHNPFNPNTCFADEYQWAAGLPGGAAVYMNANAPGATAGGNWTNGPRKASCDGTSTDPDCGWNYGDNLAGYVIGQLSALAEKPQVFVDVENGPTWQTAGVNGNVVIAAINRLRAAGYRVGIYSNAKDWSQIMGGLKLPNVQNWTFPHTGDTVGPCTPAASFTGGDVVLTQYQVATDSPVYDHDHAC